MKRLLFIASVGLLFSCNTSDCNNGEQDGNETGVDCGGDCPPCPPTPAAPVTDIDGNEYATMQIGTQVWMAENLRTTKYCNGDPIPNVTNNLQWSLLNTGAWSHYNNDSQYENPYGKLYNWYAVDDSRNICPCNWHVPTDAEWMVLRDYLGGETLTNLDGYKYTTIAGGKMKSTGTQYWISPNTDATNVSGLSALPGGVRAINGIFSSIGLSGWWWSSTEFYLGSAWGHYVQCTSGYVYSYDLTRAAGISVRCIKD